MATARRVQSLRFASGAGWPGRSRSMRDTGPASSAQASAAAPGGGQHSRNLSDCTLAASLARSITIYEGHRPPAQRQASAANLSDCTSWPARSKSDRLHVGQVDAHARPQERRKPPGWRRALATGPKARSRASQGLRRAICTDRKPGDPLPWRKTSRPSCVTGVPSGPPAVALRPARATPWQAHKLLSGQGPLFVSSSAHRALTNQGGMGRPRSGRAGSRRGVSPLRRRLGRNRPNSARFLGVLSLRLDKKVIKVKTVRRRVRGSKSCAKSLILRGFVIHSHPQKSCFRTSRVEISSLRSRETVPQKSCSRTSEVEIIHRLTHRFCG